MSVVSNRYGYLRSLTVEIPWQSIRSAPVKVKVDGLFLIAAPMVDGCFLLSVWFRRPHSHFLCCFLRCTQHESSSSTPESDATSALHRQDIAVAEALRQAKKQQALKDKEGMT
jgi:hypothetical protein